MVARKRRKSTGSARDLSIRSRAGRPYREGTLSREDMMIKGLSAVSIWSADLNNLLPFYRDVLGLEGAIQPHRFGVLGAAGGPPFGLGTHSDVAAGNRDLGGHLTGRRPAVL